MTLQYPLLTICCWEHRWDYVYALYFGLSITPHSSWLVVVSRTYILEYLEKTLQNPQRPKRSQGRGFWEYFKGKQKEWALMKESSTHFGICTVYLNVKFRETKGVESRNHRPSDGCPAGLYTTYSPAFQPIIWFTSSILSQVFYEDVMRLSVILPEAR